VTTLDGAGGWRHDVGNGVDVGERQKSDVQKDGVASSRPDRTGSIRCR
jgi:hypothetical protein